MISPKTRGAGGVSRIRRARSTLRTLAAAYLAVLVTAASAEVRDTLTYTPYLVQAEAKRTLFNLLERQSPIRRDGHIYHGYTESHIAWHLKWIGSADGRCRITAVTTELAVTITLPRLVGGSADQHSEFLRYLTALRVHEIGHYAIAQEAANAIDARLAALPEESRAAMHWPREPTRKDMASWTATRPAKNSTM